MLQVSVRQRTSRDRCERCTEVNQVIRKEVSPYLYTVISRLSGDKELAHTDSGLLTMIGIDPFR